MKFPFGLNSLFTSANCASAARCSTLDGSLHDDKAILITTKRTSVYLNGRLPQC